mmetsp:Transcript_14245/g.61002  ORF Transcript_14245/g.61002 Transcript_14245/m.61002 type:complete len:246 (-) Transcript_14245:1783-2520(-)
MVFSSPSLAWFLGLGRGIAAPTFPSTPENCRHTEPEPFGALLDGDAPGSAADAEASLAKDALRECAALPAAAAAALPLPTPNAPTCLPPVPPASKVFSAWFPSRVLSVLSPNATKALSLDAEDALECVRECEMSRPTTEPFPSPFTPSSPKTFCTPLSNILPNPPNSVVAALPRSRRLSPPSVPRAFPRSLCSISPASCVSTATLTEPSREEAQARNSRLRSVLETDSASASASRVAPTSARSPA